MTSADLKQLHPHDIPLWLAVETATWRLALAARLPLKKVSPSPRSLVTGVAGWCRFRPNEILLSLRDSWSRDEGWGERWKRHQLLDTIAHEVAHLAAGEKADHGEQFFRAFARILVLAEDINIRVDLDNSGVILKP